MINLKTGFDNDIHNHTTFPFENISETSFAL